MSMTVKPVFMRPVEIESNEVLRVTVSSVDYDVTIPAGTYATVGTLGASLYNLITAKGIPSRTFTVSIGDDFKFSIGANGSFSLTWLTGTTVRNALGFTGSEMVQGQATYTPRYCWLPTYGPSNQSRWRKKQKEVFVGDTAKNGQIAGNVTGDELYYIDFDFPHELATNIFDTAATEEADTYRNLECFSRDCRTVLPAVSTHASPKGFYVFPDVNDAIGTLTDADEIDDSGGIHFDYASNADVYVFCNLATVGVDDPAKSPSLPTSLLRYNVSFDLHTATCPSDSDGAAQWEYTSAGT